MTLVAAPAGWGKTTLLASWGQVEAGRCPFAWLSVDRWDNDPVRFWSYVVEAIRTAKATVGGEALELLRAPGTRLVESILPALINDLAPLADRVVLVVDDYHLIEEREIHESVAFLLEHLPAALRLVIATRSDPPLPLARMRARGELLEVRAEELRFSPEESTAFLNGVLGLDLDGGDLTRLHDRTEGWVAGLYLAALSLRSHSDPRPFIAAFAGDDRHIVDYLGAEVLRNQPEAVRSFMLRTSVLERLSGPLCDAVTETSGSARILREIERANLFVVPLDNRRHWYRYHHLFGGLLLHELKQNEAELVPVLHRRASAWYRAAGSIPEAIHHSIAASNLDEARELIALHWNTFFNRGRLATVAGWLDALSESTVRSDPRLCIARAWLALDFGRVEEVEAWIDAAEAGIPSGLRKKGVVALRSETAVLRTVYRFKIGDVGQAHAAARETLALAPPDAVFARTAAHCILGITLYWSGEVDGAVEVLEEAVELARSAQNDLAASYALGYLSVIHADRKELDVADALASRAMRLSEEPGFKEHFVTMMAHLARGKVREQQGDLAEAESAATRAVRLGLRGASRIEVASARLTLAELRRARGASEEARALVREARGNLSECRDPKNLATAVVEAERRVRLVPRPTGLEDAAAHELTDRELAVLRLLSTELSRQEIGTALYVSLNTVKTHMRGIFRKLRASSREEAVERARALGLI